jgi:hypothetical protein
MNTYVQIFSLNRYIWWFGNGNATTVGQNSNWYTNGVEDNLIFNEQNLTDGLPRVFASSVPNQIGVVPSYPTDASPSYDPNVRLQFTKTTNISQLRIRVYALKNARFLVGVDTCP